MGDSFYFSVLNDEIKSRIVGSSFPGDFSDAQISFDDLRYVHVIHKNFEGGTSEGELIVNKSIAEDTVAIFKELYEADYPIEKIKLIDEYGADDELSMADNNSSAFNYRVIANTSILSNHALGLAIDINPLYNPYITYIDGKENIAPRNSVTYVDRTKDFPYKIVRGDICQSTFEKYGFSWGGDWTGKKDYQHFDKR